jgi:hypothetical protein
MNQKKKKEMDCKYPKKRLSQTLPVSWATNILLFLLLAADDPVLDSPHVERPRLAWVPFDGLVAS